MYNDLDMAERGSPIDIHKMIVTRILIGLIILSPIFYNASMTYRPVRAGAEVGCALIYSPDRVEDGNIEEGDVIPSLFIDHKTGRIFIPPDHLFGEHDWLEMNTDIRFVEDVKETKVRYGSMEWKFKNIRFDGGKHIYVRSYEAVPMGDFWSVGIYQVKEKDIVGKFWVYIEDKDDLGIKAILDDDYPIYIYDIDDNILNGTGRIRVIDDNIRSPSYWEALAIPWKCDIRVKLLYSADLAILLLINVALIIKDRHSHKGAWGASVLL